MQNSKNQTYLSRETAPFWSGFIFYTRSIWCQTIKWNYSKWMKEVI